MVISRAFPPDYADPALELHSRQYNQKARMSLGYSYDTGTSRCSGSPETSTFNTIDNAFHSYLSFRLGEDALPPDEAFAALNNAMYGGDDGIVADANGEKLERAAKLMGLRIKVVDFPFGSSGVNFLARVYSPYVWFGDLNSMCDLVRHLSKFHTTTPLPPSVTEIQKFVEKARGLRLSDANTPIIRQICERAMQYDHVAPVDSLRPYNSKFDESV